MTVFSYLHSDFISCSDVDSAFNCALPVNSQIKILGKLELVRIGQVRQDSTGKCSENSKSSNSKKSRSSLLFRTLALNLNLWLDSPHVRFSILIEGYSTLFRATHFVIVSHSQSSKALSGHAGNCCCLIKLHK